MAIEEISRETLDFYAPRYEIEITGTRLEAEMSKAVTDVRVTEKINEGSSFSITMNDPFDPVTQEFKWLDHPLLSMGNTVTVRMGYESDLVTMVTGKITGLESSFFSGDSSTLTVTGQDLTYDKMKRKSPLKEFTDKSYSEIADMLATDAGLKAEVQDTDPIEGKIIKKNDMNDYDFLLQKACYVGFQLRLREETLYFVKPEDEQQEILTLQLGKDIISFNPRLNTSKIVTRVEVRQENPTDPGNPNVGIATAGDERPQEPGKTTAGQLLEKFGGVEVNKVIPVPVNQKVDVRKMATSEMDKANDSLITGETQSIGIPMIHPGVCIRLEKMGKLFSGKYFVTEATHTINNEGYRTNFSVKRNAL
ncbi:MAG: phage late control D family protein [bacterium]|nr:phage late control D family protein [bacterium]